jgi:beta-galactosidase GanA
MAGAPALAMEAPAMLHANGRHALQVDGKPYTVLAVQLHNSSAWPAVLPEVWDDVLALHPNTLEAPVYWEQFEPSPGHFDTTNFDALLAGARAHGLRLVVLWFGSWKNGQMHYVPEWIKSDPAHYPRALDEHGAPVEDLSPYAPANLQADQTAFAALMDHIRKVDGDRHTVILTQVENEPGMIGSIRDHSPAAEQLFDSPVPAGLAQALHKPTGGSWTATFGADADEQFNAYGIARYIDQVAAAGKARYPLPMYVNTWLRYKSKHMPGYDYPSGGATWNVLDTWKASAPHIDFIGTDLYSTEYSEFTKVVGQYTRGDNPPWISETGYEAGNAPYLFHVLAQGGVGFSIFGVDHAADTPERKAATEAHARNFALLGPISNLVADAAFHGTLKAAVEQRGQPKSDIALADGWTAHVSYGAPAWGDAPYELPGNPAADGHVMLLPLGKDEYLLVGFHARVEFERSGTDGRHGQILRVEEGHFEGDTWKSKRWWNGDQTDYGINLGDKPVYLKVRLGQF